MLRNLSARPCVFAHSGSAVPPGENQCERLRRPNAPLVWQGSRAGWLHGARVVAALIVAALVVAGALACGPQANEGTNNAPAGQPDPLGAAAAPSQPKALERGLEQMLVKLWRARGLPYKRGETPPALEKVPEHFADALMAVLEGAVEAARQGHREPPPALVRQARERRLIVAAHSVGAGLGAAPVRPRRSENHPAPAGPLAAPPAARADPGGAGIVWEISADPLTGAGMFIFFPARYRRGARDLLTLPHAWSDERTGRIGAALFARQPRFAAVTFNTLHRKVLDVAHAPNTPHLNGQLALVTQLAPSLIVQLHGFASAGHAKLGDALMVVSAGGRDRPLPAAGARLKRSLLFGKRVRRYGTSANELGGTTNVLFRALSKRDPKTPWLHLECSAAFRKQLAPTPPRGTPTDAAPDSAALTEFVEAFDVPLPPDSDPAPHSGGDRTPDPPENQAPGDNRRPR